MKRIAICLATYNGQEFIQEQVRSIIPQLNPGDCLFCSDDGSTDQTVNIMSIYDEIKIVNLKRCGGVVKNFNLLLNYVWKSEDKFDYVVLCDQDDVWLPNRLEIIRASLQHVDCVQLNGLVVDKNLDTKISTIFELYPPSAGVLLNLIKNSHIGCCLAFRSELLDVALPLPRYTPWHDWYIGLIAQMFFRVGQSSLITIHYRRHSNNASPTGSISHHSLWKKFGQRVLMINCLLIALYRRLKLYLQGKGGFL